MGGSDGGDDVVAVGNAFISRRSGSTDPLIEHWIGRVQEEERHARDQRHSKQQQEIAQQTAQADQQAAEAAQDLDIWWANQLSSAFGVNDEQTLHPALTVLFDALAEVSVEHDKALHRKIGDLKKYAHELVRASLKEMKVRFDEMETVFRTKHQADEKRYAEAMEQVTQRLTSAEDALADMRAVVDDITPELTTTFNASSARINDLESLYGDQRQQNEKHAEQTKLLTDRLTAVEQQTGDLQWRLDDRLDNRFDELQSEYQRQRQSDEQRASRLQGRLIM